MAVQRYLQEQRPARPTARRTFFLGMLLAGLTLALTLLATNPAPTGAQGALPQPTVIVCEGRDPSTVVVGWRDNADDETNYRIERSTDGGAFSEIATATPDSEGRYGRYLDTGLTIDPNSPNLRYRVRSYRSSDDSFSPYSPLCSNRRIRESDNFRIFYGILGTDECPQIDGRDVCLANATSTATLDLMVQALEGSRAAFTRVGFTRDSANQGGLDKQLVNVVWCDGGGCAGGAAGGGIATGLSPFLLEEPFNLTTRAGDPVAWIVIEHELLHLLQFQYAGLNDPASAWVYEGQARSSQDKICIGTDRSNCEDFDDIATGYAGYVGQVNSYLGNTNRPIIETSYDGALFWTYLTEKYGTSPPATDTVERGMNIMSEFWEAVVATPDRDGVANLNDALSNLGHSETFRDVWKDFAVSNYAKDITGSGVPSKYLYADMQEPGGTYGSPGLSLDRTLALNEQAIDTDETVTAWGAKYYEVRPAADVPIVDIEFTQDSTHPLYYTVLGIKGNDLIDEFNFDEVRDMELTLLNAGAKYDRVVVVVAGLAHQANYRYSFNGTTPTLNIVAPTTGNKARVGSNTAPDKFLAKVEIIAPDGTPFPSVDLNDFAFVVGTETVDPAQILTSATVQNQQWFVIRAPDQTNPGTYDLTVTYGGSLTDTESNAVDYSPRDDADNVLIIDRSGSMNDFGKIGDAQDAARLYVDSWRTGDQVGVVSFESTVTTDLTLRPWTDTPAGGSRQDAFDEIAALTAFGGTAIGDALIQGWNELRPASEGGAGRGDSAHDWALILLSDGLETAGTADFGDVINQIADTTSKKPVVHSVAVGPDADRLLMQRLANRTGGTYQAVSIPAGSSLAAIGSLNSLQLDMDSRYRAIATEVIGQQQFFSLVGPVNTQPFSDSINIDVESGVSELVLSVSVDTNQELDVITPNQYLLRAPDGTIYNLSSEFVSFGRWDPAEPASNIRHIVFRIPAPEAGTWVLEISIIINVSAPSPDGTGTVVPQQQVAPLRPYLVQASVRSDVTMDAFITTPVEDRDPGKPISLIASLTDTGPIVNATVIANITRPDGMVRTRQLFDDGNHNDGAANDGLYGGTFYQTAQPGSYNVLITANGQSDTAGNFQREKLLSFFISGIPGRDNDSTPPGEPPTINDPDEDGLPTEYEEEKGTDPNRADADEDPDQDGKTTGEEADEGTDPLDPDTDDDGESDGTDPDPLDPANPRVIDPVYTVAHPGNGKVVIRYTPRPGYKEAILYRAPSPDGPFVMVTTQDPSIGEFEETVPNDTVVCYYVIVVDQNDRRSAPLTPSCTTPKTDHFPPNGGVLINGGATETNSQDVTLTLFAADAVDPEFSEPGEELPPDDTATGVVEMRISNSSNMAGMSWEAYNTSKAWTLEQQTGLATVYVQYRDGAGNESEVYPATIIITSSSSGSTVTYLPLVINTLTTTN